MRPYTLHHRSSLSSELFDEVDDENVYTDIPITIVSMPHTMYDVDNPTSDTEDDESDIRVKEHIQTHSYIYSSSPDCVYFLWFLLVIFWMLVIIWMITDLLLG